MLSAAERRFLEGRRVAHLATADRGGRPHVVPVCFAVIGETLYIAIDQKPKRPSARPLKRLRNLAENPVAAVTVDHYDEDWTRLAWVMVRGRGEILAGGDEHAAAQARLRTRYPQLAAMDIAGLPVIALRIERATSWGALAAAPAQAG